MIIDHIGLVVSDYEQCKAFFSQALAPLGISLVIEVEGMAGFGKDGKPEFWLGTHSQAQNPMHIAFAGESRAQIDAFHAAALEAGAKDGGPPAIREGDHPNYYGAFVTGPGGHIIEAVCHRPENGMLASIMKNRPVKKRSFQRSLNMAANVHFAIGVASLIAAGVVFVLTLLTAESEFDPVSGVSFELAVMGFVFVLIGALTRVAPKVW